MEVSDLVRKLSDSLFMSIYNRIKKFLGFRRKLTLAWFFTGGLTVPVGGLLLAYSLPLIFWGLGWSLLLLGLLELVTGAQEWFFTRRRRRTVFEWRFRKHPRHAANEEIDDTNQHLTVLLRQRQIDLLLTVLGLALAVTGGLFTGQPITAGIGIGIMLQGAVILSLHLFTEWHLALYHYELSAFLKRGEDEEE